VPYVSDILMVNPAGVIDVRFRFSVPFSFFRDKKNNNYRVRSAILLYVREKLIALDHHNFSPGIHTLIRPNLGYSILNKPSKYS